MASKRIKRYIAGIAIVAVIVFVGTWVAGGLPWDSSSTPRPPNQIVDDLNQGILTPQQALEQLTFTYGGSVASAEAYLEVFAK